MFYKIIQIIVWPFYRLFHPIKLIGKKNIPKGKAILVCNHHSNSDVVVLGTTIFRKQHFLAKKELFSKKFNSWFLRKMSAIPIDRNAVDLKAIKACLKVLKEDKLLTIFPEGTRNQTEEALLEIKNGAGMIAVKSGAPIVPMWLEKRPRAFKKNRLIVGEPISMEAYAGQKLSNELLDEIGKKLTDAMLSLKNSLEK